MSERQGDTSSGEVVIRPVREEDADAVNELRREPSVVAGTLALPSERLADNRRYLAGLGPDDHVLIAEVGGQVIGMAGLHVNRGKLRHSGLVGMMVHQQFQGRGIGRQLLETLLTLADDYLGLVRIELEVLHDNMRAIRLYEHLGFEQEGRKRKAIRRPDGLADVLVMARLR